MDSEMDTVSSSPFGEENRSNKYCDCDYCCRTVVLNPGIKERLGQDVECFASEGFSIEKRSQDELVLYRSCLGKGGLRKLNFKAQLMITVMDFKLISSVGPLLRTLVRLSIPPVTVSDTVRVILSLVPSETSITMSPRDVAHQLHMVVRNSMASALFLQLHVILPPGVTVESVQGAMSMNEDGCYYYPTITLQDSQDIDISNSNCDDDFLLTGNNELMKTCSDSLPYVHIPVKTRMCTIRWTPILYQFIQEYLIQKPKPQLRQLKPPPTPDSTGTISKLPSQVVVCVEKLANLFRILMICRDYHPQLISHLVIVTHESLISRFRKESQQFLSQFYSPSTEKNNPEPTFMTVNDSLSVSIDNNTNDGGTFIIAIDLHPQAELLQLQTGNTKLRNAHTIILGFEKSGIPSNLSHLANHYLQIPSRTSLNLVSTISIIFHVMYNYTTHD